MQTLPSGPNRGSPCSPPPPAARGSSCREPDRVTRRKAEPPWWTAIRACKRWRRSPGSARFAAASDAASARIERAQENSQPGPCLDALRNRKPVRVSDLHEQPELSPLFGTSAIGDGIVAVVAIPIQSATGDWARSTCTTRPGGIGWTRNWHCCVFCATWPRTMSLTPPALGGPAWPPTSFTTPR
jgi:hypothetical protein